MNGATTNKSENAAALPSATRDESAVREFFFMRRALASAEQRALIAGKPGFEELQVSRSLLASAESLADVPERLPAIMLLLREALTSAVKGVALRRQLSAEATDVCQLWKAVREQEDIRPTFFALPEVAQGRINEIVESSDAFRPILGASADSLCAIKPDLVRVTRCLVQTLDREAAQAPGRVRMIRRIRWIGSAIVLSTLVGLVVALLPEPPDPPDPPGAPANRALNKKVTLSSSWQGGAYPPSRLVDGDTTQLGCHTETEKNPWAQIDLGKKRTIERVVITNRLEGLTERAVPLVIQVSTDGKRFTDFARQDNDFRTWTAKGTPTVARYVRLTVVATSILHLNEVEVY